MADGPDAADDETLNCSGQPRRTTFRCKAAKPDSMLPTSLNIMPQKPLEFREMAAAVESGGIADRTRIKTDFN